MIYLAIYIATTNDTNGNPRRGWYVSKLDGTGPTMWVEEGYRGTGALDRDIGEALLNDKDASAQDARGVVRREVRQTGRIEVTPGEYRSARKLPRFTVSG